VRRHSRWATTQVSNGPADALPQMKPVGDLDGGGSAEPGALSIGARPVPADDLHAWVSSQPYGQRTGVARREHVDYTMGFAAGQDGGADLPAAGRESSTPSTRGVLGRGSGSAMTLRIKVIRPARKPSWGTAGRRAASASPTRSRPGRAEW
jgi:hypothetical protein